MPVGEIDDIEGNRDIRFGWYLRPSYAMCRAQAEMHDLLRRQFGLVCGGVFMSHATVKGFFRSDAPVTDIVAAFDTAVAGREPFPVYNNGLDSWGPSSILLNINNMPDGTPNQPLKSIHEAGWHAIMPLVPDDCAFSMVEPALDNFSAHLTLAMADLKPEFHDEVYDFVKEAAPIGPDSFLAEYFHLFAFHSENWKGDWWSTLRWQLLHSWKLGETGEGSEA